MGGERWRGREPAGTLPELLLAAAVVVVLAALTSRGAAEGRAEQELHAASQRLVVGLEAARAAAMREGRPCGLRLGPAGWEPPGMGGLPPCGGLALAQGGESGVEVRHNLPETVRFTANGLVLDGGTVWLRSAHTSLVRCLVVSLPLGIHRLGREGPTGCEPEDTL